MRTPTPYLRLNAAAPPGLTALTFALGVSAALAEGHYCRVLRALVTAGSDGQLEAVADATLETAAGWTGTPGAFAGAFRTTCTKAGAVVGWDAMTAANRKAEGDRMRAGSYRKRGAGAATPAAKSADLESKSADSGASVPPLSLPTMGGKSADLGAKSADLASCNRVVKESSTEEQDQERIAATPRRVRRRRTRPAEQPAETWVTPYVEAWAAAYPGGTMAVRPNIQALAALEDQHGHAEVLRRWQAMLARKPASFANAWMLQKAWPEFGVSAEDGGVSTKLHKAAQRFLELLLKYGLTSMNPEQRAARIDALVADGTIGNRETFVKVLRACDLATIRDARVEVFALRHIEERAGAILTA